MSVPMPAAVPEIVAPPPRHPRFPLLDGMRAIAVLCVVLVHVAGTSLLVNPSFGGRLLSHANIGVTIFFELSGFLLYRPFIAHRGGGAPAPAVGAYFKRRFLRIYPTWWLVLTVMLVIQGHKAIGTAALWPMYSLTQNLPVYGGSGCSLVNCDFAQAWSLGAELSFYLALPVYAVAMEWLTRRMGVRRWALAQAAVLGALSAVSVVLAYVVLYPTPDWVGWTVAGNGLWFALGMGLAVASVAREPERPAAATMWPRGQSALVWPRGLSSGLWVAAAGVYVALSLAVSPLEFQPPAAQAVAEHVGFGLISLLLLLPLVFDEQRPGGIPQRVTGHPVMAWLGLISYGIFLWHAPVMFGAADRVGRHAPVALLGGTLIVSVACAAASYYVLERPIMRLKHRPLLPAARSGERAADSPPDLA